MQFAHSLDQILNAFEPEPLDGEDFADYYYDGTMESRTGDEDDFPLDDLAEACARPVTRNAHLLLGHRGYGKSTELNSLRNRLKDKDYPVIIIRCMIELDILAMDRWDIMLVISDALCRIAKEKSCPLDGLENKLKAFFTESEKITELFSEAELAMEAGAEIKTPNLLLGLLPLPNLFARLKSKVKTGDSSRKVIREHVEKHASEWISFIKELSDKVSAHLQGKQPVLIFEDMDKIAEEQKVWDVFGYGPLAEMPFPVIYTFPIALSYDSRFKELTGRFAHVVLP